MVITIGGKFTDEEAKRIDAVIAKGIYKNRNQLVVEAVMDIVRAAEEFIENEARKKEEPAKPEVKPEPKPEPQQIQLNQTKQESIEDEELRIVDWICEWFDDRKSVFNERTLEEKAKDIYSCHHRIPLERIKELMWKASWPPSRRYINKITDEWYGAEPEPKQPVDFTPPDLPEPVVIAPTVDSIAKKYLMELGYKGADPDSTIGKNMLADALNRAYNECYCPVDVTIKTIYTEAGYLKACTEFMAALAKTLDEYKGYKVG